jgi:hypothetical protein
MYQGPTAFYDISALLLTEIDQALQLSSFGSVNRICVVPGELAWDQCECGTLAASPRRFFLSDEFPEDSLGRGIVRGTPCDLPFLVAEISISIIRCAPQPPDGQLAPTCESLAAAAQVLLSDAYVVMTETISTLCTLTETNQIIDYVLGEQNTRGPDGTCVGTELITLVGIPR